MSDAERTTLETTIEGRTLELARKLTDAKMIARFAWLSNLEAKYELMSLLTHVRTAAANVVGGTFNTVISTGFEPWRKAGNFDYMKRTAFQGMDSIQSMADVERFVEQHGGVESFITELSARGVAPQAQMRAFFQEAQGKFTAGKGSVLDRTTLWEIAKKHGLNERFMDMASVFMRQSERAIRRRSWMAHYLKARDVLSVNGVQIEADHPWLIEFAQRGTEASQFLYNNATRPVFARTALGKVFSRFQLWAWNSVKFRNEIFARARIGGFTPGTPEMDKFQRMILADMFVMGLATIFPISLFGANVPAPWSYFQDLSEWMFGNSKERDKAFYGTLPYPLNITKMVMPPVGRVLDPVFVAMTGNWDRWLDYTVWTYAPFGRLARAGVKVVDNPTMVAENLFGVPLHEWQSRLKKAPQKPLISNVLGPLGVDQAESLAATPPHLRSIPDADFERLEQAYGKLNSMMRDLEERHRIQEDSLSVQ